MNHDRRSRDTGDIHTLAGCADTGFFGGNYIVSLGFTLNVYPKGIRVFAIYS